MDVPPTEILKWVGIVLAAGFVGYFGRYLAMIIIEKMRRRKAEQTPMATNGSTSSGQDRLRDEAELKLEKKRAKATSKRLKKQDKGARG